MDTPQRISHLLRRFGLGAGRLELDKYLPLGVEGTIDRLVNYDKIPIEHPSGIWDWYLQQNAEYNFEPSNVRYWWFFRMITTERPLEEKLTIFWHNHFAISGLKCEFGPEMQNYVDAMRTRAAGGFADLLSAVSRCPAMLHWLDLDQSVPGHPNENFAREVMELFTLGIGNYTERDVQEASRTFIGWSLRYPYHEQLGGSRNEKIQGAIEHGWPLVASCFSPEMQDTGHKTILGKTAPYDAEEFLRVLAYHPVTMKRMVTKLFSYFVHEDPAPATVDKFVKIWQASDLHMRPLLLAMAESDEFWSERSLLTRVKSPVDLAVAEFRQVGAGARFGNRRKKDISAPQCMWKEVGEELMNTSRSLITQGMDLLFPPDVSGWKWGKSWLTSAAMLERIRFQGLFYRTYRNGEPPAQSLIEELVAINATVTSDELIAKVLDVFDVALPQEKRKLLVELVEKFGGPTKAFANQQASTSSLKHVTEILFASPEAQFC